MAADHGFKVGDSVRIVAGSHDGAQGKIISILPDSRGKGRDFITVRIAHSGSNVETASVFAEDILPA